MFSYVWNRMCWCSYSLFFLPFEIGVCGWARMSITSLCA
uniref:Uncharacterized protein n=1 Tax=Rhizophora mucronata TaxID=61149 RepID=A0A2P2LGZ8_RHIMU